MMGLDEAIRAAMLRAVLMLAGVSVLFAVVAGGTGFLLLALYAQLSLQMNAVPASLLTALAALALAGLMIAAAAAVIRSGKGRNVQPSLHGQNTRDSDQAAFLQAAVGTSAGWVQEHPRAATLGAFAVGIVLGFSPKLRDQLFGGLADLAGKAQQR